MDPVGLGNVARDKTAVDALLGNDPARGGVSDASRGTFSAIFGRAVQKRLFKMPKMVYNNKTKAPDSAEDT